MDEEVTIPVFFFQISYHDLRGHFGYLVGFINKFFHPSSGVRNSQGLDTLYDIFKLTIFDYSLRTDQLVLKRLVQKRIPGLHDHLEKEKLIFSVVPTFIFF